MFQDWQRFHFYAKRVVKLSMFSNDSGILYQSTRTNTEGRSEQVPWGILFKGTHLTSRLLAFQGSIFPRLQTFEWCSSADASLCTVIVYHAPRLSNLRVVISESDVAETEDDVLIFLRLLETRNSFHKLDLGFREVNQSKLATGFAMVIQQNSKLRSLSMSEDLLAFEEVSTSMESLDCLERLVLEETENVGAHKLIPRVSLNFEALDAIQTTLPTALHIFQSYPSTLLTTIVISCYMEPFLNVWGMLRNLITILGQACPLLEQLQILQKFEDTWDPLISEGTPGSALRPQRACRKLKVLNFQAHHPAFANTFLAGDTTFNVPIEFNLGDEDYKELLSSWPSLENFDFDVGPERDPSWKQSPCPRATYKTIVLFTEKCPKLRVFHLPLDLTNIPPFASQDIKHAIPQSIEVMSLMRSWFPSGPTAKTRLAHVLWKATQNNPQFVISGPRVRVWDIGIGWDTGNDEEDAIQPLTNVLDRYAVWKDIEETIKKLFLYEEAFLEMETEVPRSELEGHFETWRILILLHGIINALEHLPKGRYDSFKIWLLDRVEWGL